MLTTTLDPLRASHTPRWPSGKDGKHDGKRDGKDAGKDAERAGEDMGKDAQDKWAPHGKGKMPDWGPDSWGPDRWVPPACGCGTGWVGAVDTPWLSGSWVVGLDVEGRAGAPAVLYHW